MTAEYWEYDSRTGRRWNIDPIVKTWESPFACFSDNPILNNDVHGDSDDKAIASNPNNPNAKGGKDKFHNETRKLVEQNKSIQEQPQIIQPITPNYGELLAASTGNASPEITLQHAEFSVESVGGGGGAYGVGGDVSMKRFQMIPNFHTKNHLYSKQLFMTVGLSGKAGLNGAGVSAEVGDGYLMNTDPWEPYGDIKIGNKTIPGQLTSISDYDLGASVAFLSITTTNEVTLGSSRLHYTTMGVSYGFMEKVESPFTTGSGSNMVINLSGLPSFYDSVKTTLAFPEHPKSKEFIKSLGQRRKTLGKAQKILD